MSALLEDAIVDTVAFTFVETPRWPHATADGPSGTSVLCEIASLIPRSDLGCFTGGMLDRTDWGYQDFGVRFPSSMQEWERNGELVEVSAVRDDGWVSIPAFERYVTRFLRCTIEGLTRIQDPTTQKPWWPEFLVFVDVIEARTLPTQPANPVHVANASAPLLEDSILDTVRFAFDRTCLQPGSAELKDVGPLPAALRLVFRWRLPEFSAFLLDRTAWDECGFGFTYLPECDSVEVYTRSASVRVSLRAFERCMVRFLRCTIEGLVHEPDPVVSEPWWSDFLTRVDAISLRCR